MVMDAPSALAPTIHDAATVELENTPITPDWILRGTPISRSKTFARSKDWTSHMVIWDCTEGAFHWHYSTDEVIIVLSGVAYMTSEQGGEERRYGPGDVGFFPAGTSCTWRVTEPIRKIAILRETMWAPLGMGLKLWNKILRTVGLTGKLPSRFTRGLEVVKS
jgi:uncharacterized cupin superfamily protein